MPRATVPNDASAAQRPLRVRVRQDLICSRQRYQGGDYWLVKDPLTLQYFRFQEEEYWLLQSLTGQATVTGVQEEFQKRFAPQKILAGELQQFLGMLFRSGLVIADSPEQGRQLWQRRQKQERQERWGQLVNLLSYRFPGFDPGRILDRLAPWTDCFFSPAAMFGVLLLSGIAVTIGLVQFEYLQQRLPSFEQFFAVQNWIFLAVTLAVTKVLHELGHGLACRRFGGQCHEMGVMLLVLTPCLYCNVSDAWMIPSKWKRIFISAAGMYVELAMAAVAMLVWSASQPGFINSMALNLIFVCGVSTLLFNLNPLLRFDGYYILADWLEIPNLRQKASKLLQGVINKWCLGIPVPHDPFLPQRHVGWFVLYSVAAGVYRWVLTLTVFWFLYGLLEPYGLKILSQLLAAFSLVGLVIFPAVQMFRFFKTPGKVETVKPWRVAMTLGGLLLVVVGVMLIPLPHYVDMPLFVQPANMMNVYVETSGNLQEVTVKKYQYVQAGDPVVRLTSHDLERQRLVAANELKRSEHREQEIRMREVSGDQHASLARESSEVQRLNNQQQLEDYQRRIESLEVKAPLSGWLIPAARIEPPSSDAERLPTLVGDPLEPSNGQAVLAEQTLVAHIAPDQKNWEAMILVDQEEVEFTRVGQEVKVWLAQFPNQVFRTKIDEVAVDPLRVIPPQMASLKGGPVETIATEGGRFKATSAKYLVIAPLDNPDNLMAKDLTGIARIHVGYRTVGNRLARYLAHTFNFKL
jgi:putative peptide zinc metalloprotease protein